MANKTREESNKTRESILKASLDVFRDKGYSRTTMMDIAQKAGVTRGAVYGHFTNKIDIFEELLKDWNLPTEIMSQELSGELDSCDKISEICVKVLSKLEEDGFYRAVYDLVMDRTELTAELEPFQQRVKKSYQDLLQMLEFVLKRAQERHEISGSLNIRQTSVALLAYFIGLGQVWSMNDTMFPLKAWASHFLELFFKGLREG